MRVCVTRCHPCFPFCPPPLLVSPVSEYEVRCTSTLLTRFLSLRSSAPRPRAAPPRPPAPHPRIHPGPTSSPPRSLALQQMHAMLSAGYPASAMQYQGAMMGGSPPGFGGFGGFGGLGLGGLGLGGLGGRGGHGGFGGMDASSAFHAMYGMGMMGAPLYNDPTGGLQQQLHRLLAMQQASQSQIPPFLQQQLKAAMMSGLAPQSQGMADQASPRSAKGEGGSTAGERGASGGRGGALRGVGGMALKEVQGSPYIAPDDLAAALHMAGAMQEQGARRTGGGAGAGRGGTSGRASGANPELQFA